MMSKFSLGRLVVTRSIAKRMEYDSAFTNFVDAVLRRYINCDWGDLVDDDKKQNDYSVKNDDGRILAAYTYSPNIMLMGNEKSTTELTLEGETIWIITEWDRSVTTILFPDEY